MNTCLFFVPLGHDQVDTVIRRIRETMREVHHNVTEFQVGRDVLERNLSSIEGILVQLLRIANLFHGDQKKKKDKKKVICRYSGKSNSFSGRFWQIVYNDNLLW